MTVACDECLAQTVSQADHARHEMARLCRKSNVILVSEKHLLDVADSQLHEGLQCFVKSALTTGCSIQVRQVPPHPCQPMECCRNVDGIKVLTGSFYNVQDPDNRVGIDNAPVDVPMQVCHCRSLAAAADIHCHRVRAQEMLLCGLDVPGVNHQACSWFICIIRRSQMPRMSLQHDAAIAVKAAAAAVTHSYCCQGSSKLSSTAKPLDILLAQQCSWKQCDGKAADESGSL